MLRAAAVLTGCLLCATSAAFAQSRAMIQKLDNEWAAAFNKGDAAAVAAMYTTDAYVLPPGSAMVRGHKAIAELWRKNMKAIGDIRCTAMNVKRLGPSAAREIGTCTFMTKTRPAKAGGIKYAVVWEKEGGHWKLLQDIWNAPK